MHDKELQFDTAIFIHKVVTNADQHFPMILDENWKVEQLIEWCKQNCNMSYVIFDYKTFCFRDKDDALRFKLTWG